ncbi:MAG: hypothetical protein ABH952_08520 [Candidatus Omnitrophota bacterium]
MNQKYFITPQIEREIINLYQKKASMGSDRYESHCKDLAEKYGLPRWKITRYAQRKGLIAVGKKEPDWSEKEMRILEKHAEKVPERIQIHLRKAGFTRSLIAIVLKRKRLNLLAQYRIEGQSARVVAECLGVDVHAVTRWIKLGHLKATRRGTKRTELQGGDHWEIKTKDLRDFVINYLVEIDLRKVDKFWFVDLLTNKLAEFA